MIVAHGVFEHLDLDTAFWFLEDSRRVLKQGGSVAFNFDNATTREGLAHLRTTSTPERPSLFRFHAPEAISAVAAAAGFSSTEIRQTKSRISFAILRQ
jgi:hypothetical protein